MEKNLTELENLRNTLKKKTRRRSAPWKRSPEAEEMMMKKRERLGFGNASFKGGGFIFFLIH